MRWKLATLVLQTHQGTWLQRLETCCSWRRTCRAKSANVSVVSGGCLSATANVDGVSGSVAPRSVEGYWWWRGCRRRRVWEQQRRPLQIRSPGTMQRWHVREQQIRLRRRGSAFLLRHGSASGGLTARIVTGDGVCMTSSVYIGAWRGLWLWSESEILTNSKFYVSDSRLQQQN